jgi:hypothetical protein
MTDEIKRRMRRRSAVEPVIGHLKSEHRMGRNHLAHAVLAAAGYNFRRLLAWLAILLALIAHTLRASQQPQPTATSRTTTSFDVASLSAIVASAFQPAQQQADEIFHPALQAHA